MNRTEAKKAWREYIEKPLSTNAALTWGEDAQAGHFWVEVCSTFAHYVRETFEYEIKHCLDCNKIVLDWIDGLPFCQECINKRAASYGPK